MPSTGPEPVSSLPDWRDPERVQVVVGVIGHQGRYLVAQRQQGQDFSRCLEFPGGKVNAGENLDSALRRELHEELGLRVIEAVPLLRVPYDYPHKSVMLHVYQVTRFEGEPQGREGQTVMWLNRLPPERFPEANRHILQALALPDTYVVTPPWYRHFWRDFETLLSQGRWMICFRQKHWDRQTYAKAFERAWVMCHERGSRLLLHARPELAADLAHDGIHLTSAQLFEDKVENPADTVLAASCHNPMELQQALIRGVDFCVLSPINRPRSHGSDLPALGWPQFACWSSLVPMPVYAMGGVAKVDLERARHHWAQGVAGISDFWSGQR